MTYVGGTAIDSVVDLHQEERDRLRRRMACGAFQVLERRDEALEIDFRELLRLSCRVEQGRLCLRFSGAPPWANRLWLELPARPEESLYGGGEQFSVLSLRGRKLPVWVQEQGVGHLAPPLLAAIAPFLSFLACFLLGPFQIFKRIVKTHAVPLP